MEDAKGDFSERLGTLPGGSGRGTNTLSRSFSHHARLNPVIRLLGRSISLVHALQKFSDFEREIKSRLIAPFYGGHDSI